MQRALTQKNALDQENIHTTHMYAEYSHAEQSYEERSSIC